GGRWSIPPHGGALSSPQGRHRADHRSDHEMHEGRRQTIRRSADAGSRLKLIDASGRSRLIRQPFSRNGENSLYGMLGGIVETSASFEARSAPRSYPTVPDTVEDRDCSAPGSAFVMNAALHHLFWSRVRSVSIPLK